MRWNLFRFYFLSSYLFPLNSWLLSPLAFHSFYFLSLNSPTPSTSQSLNSHLSHLFFLQVPCISTLLHSLHQFPILHSHLTSHLSPGLQPISVLISLSHLSLLFFSQTWYPNWPLVLEACNPYLTLTPCLFSPFSPHLKSSSALVLPPFRLNSGTFFLLPRPFFPFRSLLLSQRLPIL